MQVSSNKRDRNRSLWIEGTWDGADPVVPREMTEFVWFSLFYGDHRDFVVMSPVPKSMLGVFLAPFASQEREARWFWRPLRTPPRPLKKR